MAYKNDSYSLNYSSSPITITGAEEETASLQLQEAPTLPLELFGYIYSTTEGETPIVNAFVAVYDASNNIVTSTYTDGSGYYSFTTLSAGTYQVNASAVGFTPSDVTSITLNDVPVQQDIVLQPYSSSDRVIYGIVTDLSTTNAISGARIDIVDNNNGDVIASTTSISNGAYSVYDLEDGNYTVNVSAIGYSAQNTTATISDVTPFVEVDIALSSYTPPTENATISGYITNTTGDPLINAWVGLYSENDTETLIATTISNNSGFYIFENVLPGSYIVKAKVQV